jgi:hypothetical protein
MQRNALHPLLVFPLRTSATPRPCVENTVTFRCDGPDCRPHIPRTNILAGRCDIANDGSVKSFSRMLIRQARAVRQRTRLGCIPAQLQRIMR